MANEDRPITNKEAVAFAAHIGKGLVQFIPMACHREVWCYLFDEAAKHGWKLKEEIEKND